MEENDSSEISVFVVWSSQLGAKESHLPEAMELMPDPRARHYWDPSDQVGKAYQDRLPDPAADGETISLGSAAWDVWMIFDGEVTWTEAGVPEPAWWEHQLRGLTPERRLDPERFARRAGELLESRPGPE